MFVTGYGIIASARCADGGGLSVFFNNILVINARAAARIGSLRAWRSWLLQGRSPRGRTGKARGCWTCEAWRCTDCALGEARGCARAVALRRRTQTLFLPIRRFWSCERAAQAGLALRAGCADTGPDGLGEFGLWCVMTEVGFICRGQTEVGVRGRHGFGRKVRRAS